MKLGKCKITELTESEKDLILLNIIKDCIQKAGDSYEEFGRSVLKTLVHKKLVDYGNDGCDYLRDCERTGY